MKPQTRAEAIRIRRRAQTSGKLKYNGTPCKHGHSGVRYTSNGMCVDCASKLNTKDTSPFGIWWKATGRAKGRKLSKLAWEAALQELMV